jgi:hypothetical protein
MNKQKDRNGANCNSKAVDTSMSKNSLAGGVHQYDSGKLQRKKADNALKNKQNGKQAFDDGVSENTLYHHLAKQKMIAGGKEKKEESIVDGQGS